MISAVVMMLLNLSVGISHQDSLYLQAPPAVNELTRRYWPQGHLCEVWFREEMYVSKKIMLVKHYHKVSEAETYVMFSNGTDGWAWKVFELPETVSNDSTTVNAPKMNKALSHPKKEALLKDW